LERGFPFYQYFEINNKPLTSSTKSYSQEYDLRLVEKRSRTSCDPAKIWYNVGNVGNCNPFTLGTPNQLQFPVNPHNCFTNLPLVPEDSGSNGGWIPNWLKWTLGAVIIVGLGVATILTGGAAGAIVTGAFIGAGVGGVSSIAIGFATGQSLSDIANNFLSGVLIGGITGAIGGMGAPAGFGAVSLSAKTPLLSAIGKSAFQHWAFQMAANAAVEGVSYLVKAGNNGTWAGFGLAFAAGGVSGLVPSTAFRAMVMTTYLDYLTNRTENLFGSYGWI